MSVKACRVRNPLARFLTILIILFSPSAIALVNLVSMNVSILCMCLRSILTNLRMGSSRLLSAVVVQRFINLSAAQGALYSQKCSNSSFSTHALWICRFPFCKALSVRESLFDRVEECLNRSQRSPFSALRSSTEALRHSSFRTSSTAPLRALTM